MRSVRMPASRLRSSTRFLTSSPAPTSSEKATAISAMTRPLPKRRPDPLPVRTSPSRTADASSDIRSTISGAMPQKIPTATETTAVKARTRPSMAMVAARGSCVPASATKVWSTHCASTTPIAPPVSESSSASSVS